MREREYLRHQYSAILSSVGLILLLAALTMLMPLLILFSYPDEVRNAPAFMVPAGCLAMIGFGLQRFYHRPSTVTLSIQEGGTIVLISWIMVMVFSAWPFMSILRLDFSRAVFESVSGWTTTGLSVVDVTSATRMILFWRSLMQLAGGAGLAIIMMSAIVGPVGVGISSAEGRSDQLVPQVRKSARLVLMIYTGYAATGILVYWLAGMSPFDALNHSFAAVSTGGFSTQAESIGHWDSLTIEAVTLLLMLLGNLSFVTAWLLWRGKIRFVTRNSEVHLLAVIIPTAVLAVFLFTCLGLYPLTGKAVRVAVFETITAITTTGFSTVSYSNWNGFGVLVLIALMLVGGGTCSTAGGLKQFRVYLLLRLLGWEVKRSLQPRTTILERPVWEGNHRIFVDDARIRQISVFVFLYMVSYLFGALLLCACGYSLKDSLFEFASAIGTVGLSVGVTSADMPDAALWAETAAMVLGRLEFTVIILSVIKMMRDSVRLIVPMSSGERT